MEYGFKFGNCVFFGNRTCIICFNDTFMERYLATRYVATEKQLILFNFIKKYKAAYEMSPTIKLMCAHMEVKSDNSILKHLRGLEKKGYIKKERVAYCNYKILKHEKHE